MPSKEDSKFNAWNCDNNMVMPWIINSITLDTGENFMFYETLEKFEKQSRKLSTRKHFKFVCNRKKSSWYTSEDLSITWYFNLLTQQYQKVDLFKVCDWKDPGDGLKYKNTIEKKCFLNFLRDWIQILMKSVAIY